MAAPIAASGGPQSRYSADDEKLFSKLSWHLLPLLIVCYVIAFLDRINIGFAQLQMKQTLPFSDAAYAFGAGVFFIGYFLFEVPSNLMLEKIGARKTLLRILFCWGIAAAGMAFVETTTAFYILRFLLGACEAGFFPGIILYLTYWYPSARRGKCIAVFMTGSVIAYLIAGPTSGWIMKYMDGWHGLHGWQWLFIVQGLPASVLGLIAFFTLKDRPEDANWLTPAEKASLRHHLSADAQAVATASHGSLLGLIRDPKIYSMAIVYFLLLGATYAMIFWSPTLIRGWGIKDIGLVGLLSALPALFGIVGMVLIGRSSDRHLERRGHFALAMALCAVGLAITIVAQGSLVGSLFGLCVLGIGQAASTPIFFAAVSEYIPKETAAGGIALVSSLGNLGPAVMPSITTWLNTTTGTPVNSMYLVIVLFAVAGMILALALRPAAARTRLVPG